MGRAPLVEGIMKECGVTWHLVFGGRVFWIFVFGIWYLAEVYFGFLEGEGLSITRNRNEKEMEILDRCQPCLQLVFCVVFLQTQ